MCQQSQVVKICEGFLDSFVPIFVRNLFAAFVLGNPSKTHVFLFIWRRCRRQLHVSFQQSSLFIIQHALKRQIMWWSLRRFHPIKAASSLTLHVGWVNLISFYLSFLAGLKMTRIHNIWHGKLIWEQDCETEKDFARLVKQLLPPSRRYIGT